MLSILTVARYSPSRMVPVGVQFLELHRLILTEVHVRTRDQRMFFFALTIGERFLRFVRKSSSQLDIPSSLQLMHMQLWPFWSIYPFRQFSWSTRMKGWIRKP